MNAGPADTRSPHLDLEDLIAEVTGQATDDRAREHLARCEHCRAEANRWNLVADGVRGLAADTPETAQPARPRHTPAACPGGSRAAHHAGRQRGGRARPPRRRRLRGGRTLSTSSSGTAGTGNTVLTAVSGCAGARAGQRDAGAGERQQPGHQDGQRPAGDRDHDAVHESETCPERCCGDITDGASVTVARPKLRRDDRGRPGRPSSPGRRAPGAAAGHGRRQGDGIGREHLWFYRRHVRWNPRPGDHLGRDGRRA